MAGVFKRRGQTWQSPEWRQHLVSASDLNRRALAALTRIETAARVAEPVHDSYSLTRMVAPFFDDGCPVGGAFSIRPEFRGFA